MRGELGHSATVARVHFVLHGFSVTTYAGCKCPMNAIESHVLPLESIGIKSVVMKISMVLHAT